MLLAEVCHVKGVTDGAPPEYDWEIYLKETARKIIEQQTPSQVLLVRSRLYELLVRLIPPNIIFQVITKNTDTVQKIYSLKINPVI